MASFSIQSVFKLALILSGALVGFVLARRALNVKKAVGSDGQMGATSTVGAVRFSNSQLTAMRSLWQWYRTGTQPATPSLAVLEPSEISDLLTKCSQEQLPADLRTDVMRRERARFIKEFEALGMDEIEAEILAGMKQGRLGPANDL